MEDLNKSQIVLLTLLISFVTSIATGIMTSSLLQQAPIEVTRNINRIVEKTIETVTPAIVNNSSTQKEITTVVVKEDDLIVDSIDKNLKSVVRIKEKDGNVGVITFYGIGLVLTKDGIIIADRKKILSENIYIATMSDGKEFPLIPIGVDKQTNFILFKANQGEKITEKTSYPFFVGKFSDVDAKLGQTIIALGGDETNAVSVGRVISFDMKESGVGTSTTKYLAGLETDLVVKDLVSGSPVFNLSGDVIGFKLSADSSKVIVPVSILKKELSILNDTTKTP